MENVAAVLHGPCEVKIVSNHYLSKLLLCRHSSSLAVTVIGICVQVQILLYSMHEFYWSEFTGVNAFGYCPISQSV